MANKNDNLIPAAHKLTAEEHSKGGKRSQEVAKAKKQLREALQALLDGEIHDKNGNTMSGNEAMAVKAFQAAIKGDWKAWELVRDTSGQKPTEKIDIVAADFSALDAAFDTKEEKSEDK